MADGDGDGTDGVGTALRKESNNGDAGVAGDDDATWDCPNIDSDDIGRSDGDGV